MNTGTTSSSCAGAKRPSSRDRNGHRAPISGDRRWNAYSGVSAAPRRSNGAHPAFTIIELLIVISIIVLVLGLAIPAFNVITGSKSLEATQNQVAAMVGRARAEALGVQEVRGVMFYIDPESERVAIALVHEVEAPAAAVSGIDIYLDRTTDGDTLVLPAGVGVQTIDEQIIANKGDDQYIGYNTLNSTTGADPTIIKYGGVILFDSRGQITSRTYAFKTHAPDSLGVEKYTSLGVMLYIPEPDPLKRVESGPVLLPNNENIVPVDPAVAVNGRSLALRSALGFVLFEQDAFLNQPNVTLDDQQVRKAGTDDQHEDTEEGWLDSNATPVMVNRYNGTLVKGE